MNPHAEYLFSEDATAVDVDALQRLLNDTYWAADRTRETVERSLAESLCFSASTRDGHELAAFLRVVTDQATFSWICDVIVAPAHRGRGLARRLLSSALAHPGVAGTNCVLATRDAHGLYEKFGFERREMMRRPRS